MYLKSPYPSVAESPDENVHHLIFGSKGEDYVAQIDVISGRKRTKGELEERVRDAATALGVPISEGGMGLSAEAGDVVGICSGNCMDYVTLVQACFVVTTPFSLISSFSTHHEMVHALRLSKVTRIFVEPRLVPRMLSAANEVGLSEDRIHILEGSSHDRRKSLHDLIIEVQRRRTPRLAVRPAKKNTLAYLVFSSGTTGLPKAVMISHGNIWYTMQALKVIEEEDFKALQVTPPNIPVWLGVLPFHHTFGLHANCIRGVLERATIAIVPRWDLHLVLAAIPKYRINVLILVPSFIHALANSGLLDKADLSSVWSLSTGAAYLPPKVEEKFLDSVKQVPRASEGYGLSECTLSAMRRPVPGVLGGRQPVRGTAGILNPGQEARLLRDDGSDVGLHEPGELWLRGGNIALGYLHNEKATKETFVDGWLRTGDRFKVDEEHNFHFVDRIKDTLKISGVQVSPTEIEEVLRMHPDKLISDVCVAGVSGGRTSDEKIPRAWIVLSEEGKRKGVMATVSILEAWSKKNLSSYKWLRGGVEIVDQIPKSPTGKVLRRELQDRHEQEQQSQQTRTKL